MQITDIIAHMGGITAMAHELGISEEQAMSGAAALGPAVLGGFKKQAQTSSTGLEGLGGWIGRLGGASLLDDVLVPQPTNVNRGNEVLGEIFGSRDVSRTVAQSASGTSGLDPAVLRKMLSMVAMLVAGFMAKQKAAPAGGSGGLGGLLGGLIGDAAPGSSGAATGLASMLDLDGNGNPLDDILRMAAKGTRQSR